MDFIEQYVSLRFRLWYKGDIFVIYESFPEEGPGVSKKLRQFNNQSECEEWLEAHKAAYTKWLKTFMVTSVTSPMGPAPSALTTTSAIARAKAKLSPPSSSTSKTTSEVPPKEPTSSEISPTSSTESKLVNITAMKVEIGDMIIGFGVVNGKKINRKTVHFSLNGNSEGYTTNKLDKINVVKA